MQYLEYLQKQISELRLSSVLITMLYKTYIIVAIGIIEMLFSGTLKAKKLWKTSTYELLLTTKSNSQKYENKKIKNRSEYAPLLYIALETMRDGDGTNSACFGTQDINRLPNFDDEQHPLFEYHYYGIARENRERVKEKYDIPDYYVQRVRFTDFIHE